MCTGYDVNVVVIIIIIVVFGKHYRPGLIQKLITFLTDFEQPVIVNVFQQQIADERLSDNSVPELFIIFFATTKRTDEVVFVGFEGSRISPDQNIYNVSGFKQLLNLQHGFQRYGDISFPFKLFLWMQAVVTGAAVVGFVLFAKVMQQLLVAAHRRLGIRNCFEEQLLGNFLLGNRLPFMNFSSF